MMRSVATAFIAMMILGSVLTITKSTAATGRRTSNMDLTDANAVLLPNRSPLVSFRILFMTGSASDPNGVWVTEIWDSPEDHAASLTRPEARALIAEFMPLIAALPERAEKLTLLGGKGPR